MKKKIDTSYRYFFKSNIPNGLWKFQSCKFYFKTCKHLKVINNMYHKELKIQKLLVIFIYVNFYLLMATNLITHKLYLNHNLFSKICRMTNDTQNITNIICCIVPASIWLQLMVLAESSWWYLWVWAMLLMISSTVWRKWTILQSPSSQNNKILK